MAFMIDRDAPKSGIARLMAMKGRHGDSELVHMNPEEVKGLQALGKLTVNPDTGLPEAFNLAGLLPAAAGMAATMFMPAMAPAVAPWIGGALAAGGTSMAVNRGDVGAAAFDALIAGAGAALAGSSLGADTLSSAGMGADKIGTAINAGAGADAELLGNLAINAGEQVPIASALPAALGGNPAASVLGPITQADLASGAISALPTAGLAALGQPTSGAGMLESLQPPPLASANRPRAQSAYGTRAGEEISQTPAVRDGLTEEDVLNSALGRTDPLQYFEDPRNASAPAGLYGASPEGTQGSPQPLGGSRLSGTQYAADGGSLTGAFERMGGDYRMVARAVAGSITQGQIPYEGEGDAMSDHVMYPVAKQRPTDPDAAALSPDEYIIDGHTVAALGNGSTNAGADRLDRFVQGVRKKAYGKNAQPKKINGIAELARLS